MTLFGLFKSHRAPNLLEGEWWNKCEILEVILLLSKFISLHCPSYCMEKETRTNTELSGGEGHKCFLPPVRNSSSNSSPGNYTKTHRQGSRSLRLPSPVVLDTHGGTQSIREGGNPTSVRTTGSGISVLKMAEGSAGLSREQSRAVPALAFGALNHCSPGMGSWALTALLSQIQLIIAGV